MTALGRARVFVYRNSGFTAGNLSGIRHVMVVKRESALRKRDSNADPDDPEAEPISLSLFLARLPSRAHKADNSRNVARAQIAVEFH
jgi:hypothetical protein